MGQSKSAGWGNSAPAPTGVYAELLRLTPAPTHPDAQVSPQLVPGGSQEHIFSDASHKNRLYGVLFLIFRDSSRIMDHRSNKKHHEAA